MKFLSFQRSASIKVLSDVVILTHHPCPRALDDHAGMGFDWAGFTGTGLLVYLVTPS